MSRSFDVIQVIQLIEVMPPFVSIVICTKIRQDALETYALPSIQKLNDPNFEVVVVDDASTDGIQEFQRDDQPGAIRLRLAQPALNTRLVDQTCLAIQRRQDRHAWGCNMPFRSAIIRRFRFGASLQYSHYANGTDRIGPIIDHSYQRIMTPKVQARHDARDASHRK